MKQKRIFYNLISGLLAQAIAFVMAFLIPRLFLVNFGSEIKGMLSTITQVFSYLWLLEAGVGLAATQALYAPVSREDYPAVNSILAAASHYYTKTGILYLAVVLLFAGTFSIFTETTLSRPTLFLVVLLQGLPNVLSYLVQGKYRILLQAEGKSYIFNNLNIAVQFFVNFGKVAVLLLTKDLVLVQSLPLFSTLFQLWFLLFYLKKRYPWLNLRTATPDYASISQKSSVLVHQISGVIFNNTDVILLSMFCGFKTASVYTVYNSFYLYADTFLSTLSSSFTFSLGQLFHTDRKRFQKLFDLYETGYIMLSFLLYTGIYLFLLPVIRIYTRGITDINYMDAALPMLFTMLNLAACGKLPANQAIVFAGHFKRTQWHSVTEALLNLSLSVIGVLLFGIYGGLFGSIAAVLFRGIAAIFHASRTILFRSPGKSFQKIGLNLVLFFLIVRFANPSSHDLASYAAIVQWGLLYGVGIFALYLAANCLAFRELPGFIRYYLNERIQKRP